LTVQRIFLLASLALPAISSAALAASADGAAHAGAEKGKLLSPLQQGLPAMIAAFLIFGIVYFILSSKAWPGILSGLKNREAKIQGEIEAAEMARTQAKMALEQYEKSLAEARTSAQKMITDAKAQQAQQLAELRVKAEADIAAQRTKLMGDIEAAKKAALAEIYAQSAQLATGVAGRILQREVNPGDQQRFVEEALAGLGRKN
jgi:F-type H+-transporting ATPase subunit b